MISNPVRRHWVLFPSWPCSFVALAGGDGEDGAHLSVLVQEAVALVSLRNAGAGLPVRPQATDFWIRRTPERKTAFTWNDIIWITLRNKHSQMDKANFQVLFLTDCTRCICVPLLRY